MNSDERLDRLERILTLMIRQGRRQRTNVREADERIKMLINAQIKTEDELEKMRLQSAAIRDDLYERTRDIFELFRLTDQNVTRLTEVQTMMGQQLSVIIERFGTQ